MRQSKNVFIEINQPINKIKITKSMNERCLKNSWKVTNKMDRNPFKQLIKLIKYIKKFNQTSNK